MITQIKIFKHKPEETRLLNDFLKGVNSRLISIQTVIVWEGYGGWVQITTIYYFQEEQS